MRGFHNFFLLFRDYCISVRYVLYYMGRWFITPSTKIEALLPRDGTIVDIGCGEGILDNLLALRAPNRRVIGFDLNARRVQVAESIKKKRAIPNVEFFVADALTHDWGDAAAVVMIDVLHHIPDLHEQEKVVMRVSERLDSGAQFIVREPGLEDQVKARLAYWGDVHLLYRGDVIIFRKKSEWKALFEKAGFEVTIYNTNHLSPLSSYLFVCKKR